MYAANLIRCKTSDHGNEAKIESASFVLKAWNNGLRSSFILQKLLGLPGEVEKLCNIDTFIKEYSSPGIGRQNS